MEDIFTGKEIRVTLTRPTLCHRCNGSGADTDDGVHTCPKCKGRGVYMRTI